MKKNPIYLLALTVLLSVSTAGAYGRDYTVKSPDGNTVFTLTLSEGSLPKYSISYKNTMIIRDGEMGFIFDSGEFGKDIKAGKAEKTSGTETYDLITGKCSHVEDRYNGMTIPLIENGGAARRIDIAVKVFDSGAAFRYVFPEQEGWESYEMLDELTTFDFAGDPDVLTMFLSSYTSSHENYYSRMRYSAIPEGKLMEMPAMYTFGDGIFVSITEAAVRDYAGMYLMKEDGHLKGKLSPLPGRPDIKVIAEDLPHRSPWRVIMTGGTPGDLISSNILTSLNDPCAIDDVSWIKPGKTTFSWWNGNEVPDTTFLPGNNFMTNKYYIDFAADAGLDFHSVYGFAEQPWYVDKNVNFALPAEDADILTPVRSLDMDAVAEYAALKGIGLHLWVNWKPFYRKLDAALDLFESWGVKGLMVDFMDRDDQEMIRIQEEILKKSAGHKIFIQFHGSSKPSGLNRTYPNEFAREGTLNYECFKWTRHTGADHDVAIPFTRLLAGVTDFHLGGFRAVPEESFRIRYTNPLVTVTRGHMLGMYVVLECYLGMICDSPAAYKGQPGFEFLQKVPTSWDETTVPAASVNEYAVVARRKGDDWYAGGINGSARRTVSFKTDFLGAGRYTAEIFMDADDADMNPNHLRKTYADVTKDSTLTLELACSGGFAIHFKPELGDGIQSGSTGVK